MALSESIEYDKIEVVGDTNSTQVAVKDGAYSDITRNDLFFTSYHFSFQCSYIVSQTELSLKTKHHKSVKSGGLS